MSIRIFHEFIQNDMDYENELPASLNNFSALWKQREQFLDHLVNQVFISINHQALLIKNKHLHKGN